MNTEFVSYQEEKKGFKVHGIVTLCVVALLATINLTLCPQFIWFIFPLGGMSIGLGCHYFFGLRRARKTSMEA